MERQNTPHPKKAGVGFADEDDENAGANNDEKKAVSPVASRRKTPFPKKVGVGFADQEDDDDDGEGDEDNGQFVTFAAGTAGDGGSAGGGNNKGSRPTIASRRKTPFPAKLADETSTAIDGNAEGNDVVA